MEQNKVLDYDQEMLYFLNEASDVLFSSLTLEDNLMFDKISGLIVPRLAEWFTVDTYNEQEGYKLLLLAHKDPQKVRWGYSLREKYPLDTNISSGVPKVIHTGISEIYEDITDEMLQQAARNEEHLRLIRSMGFRSAIIAPLTIRHESFGAITFVSVERAYSSEDLYLIESFAHKVAIAIDNHRLYQRSQMEIARSRQAELKVKRLLREGREHQEWLDNIIRTVPGIVWETRFDPGSQAQQVIFVSDYAVQMLGYTKEEWLETPNFWIKIMHPEDVEKARFNARKTLEAGFGQNQYRMVSKSGKELWTEARSIVVYDEDKNATGMRGVTFDVTRMKELEERKDEFLSIASHELKTPITSAKIITQVLSQHDKEFTEEQRQFIQKLDKQLDKLTQLINSMLDVNRLKDGRIDFQDKPFDINYLIEDIVESLKIIVPNDIEIVGRSDRMLNADRERISQVVLNLVNNAIKYSEKGKPIKIHVNCQNDSLLICVEDQGVGIEPRFATKIFDKFFRVPDARIKYISGVGIGLNISREIVWHYNGNIWTDSTPGKGSKFFVSLPKEMLV